MKLLITGVSGFVGQAVIARLIRDNPFSAVHGIDRTAPRVLGPVRFIQADLRTVDLGDLLVTDGVDVVLHLAFGARAGLSNSRAEIDVARRLMEVAEFIGLPRLVLASRDRVYAPSVLPVREDAPLRSPQGQPAEVVAKLQTERLAEALPPTTRVVVVRCANILGPTPGGNLQTILTLPWILAPRERDPLIQLLHVDDAAAIFLAACASPGPASVYNAGGAEPIPLSVVAGILERPILRPHAGLTRCLVGALSHTRLMPLGARELAELHGGVPLFTRRLAEGLYQPRFSTRQTLAVWRAGYVEEARCLARSAPGGP